jgi:hypothetical protein
VPDFFFAELFLVCVSFCPSSFSSFVPPSTKIVGHLMPGTKLQMHFDTANAEAGPEVVPADSTVRKCGEEFMFTGGRKITDAEGKPT